MRNHIRQSLIIALFVAAGLTWAMVAARAQGANHIQRGATLAPVELNLAGAQSRARPRRELHRQRAGRLQRLPYRAVVRAGGDPFAGEPEDQHRTVTSREERTSGRSCRATSRRAPTVCRPAARSINSSRSCTRAPIFSTVPGTPILQVMPWPVYGKMSDHELEAIYEYLRAIPTINPRPDFCTAPPPPA